MKEYPFEYTCQGYALLLFIESFVILIGGLFLCRLLIGKAVPASVIVFILLALSIGFFLVNKHKIKRNGFAKLGEDEVILEISKEVKVPFENLKYYYSFNGKNGYTLTLGLRSGEKIKISASNIYCNVDAFAEFIKDLFTTIEQYQTQYDPSIIHLESIYARKYTPMILGLLTIIVLGGYYFTEIPLKIVPIALTLPLFINWIKYFQLKNQNKLVDF